MEEKIILENDLGEETELSFVEETKFKEKKYILVENDKEECLILRDDSSELEEYASYEIVDDEEEVNALLEIFQHLLDENEE